MENLKELKSELDQIEMEYKEHWDSYPVRENMLPKWRQKGQELSRTKRQLKLKIQEIERVT